MREIHKAKLDSSKILFQTGYQALYRDSVIERGELLSKDPQRKERLTKALCPVCFYGSSRIGGSICTEVICADCDTRLRFSNTCTDILCELCATRLRLCRHCGADLDLKFRRKPRSLRVEPS